MRGEGGGDFLCNEVKVREMKTLDAVSGFQTLFKEWGGGGEKQELTPCQKAEYHQGHASVQPCVHV